MAVTRNFERFQYFNFETNFQEKKKTFFKKLEDRFQLKLILKTHCFHTKLPCQKLMLRQIEWGVQKRPITKNGVLAVTALIFLKMLFQFKNLL